VRAEEQRVINFCSVIYGPAIYWPEPHISLHFSQSHHSYHLSSVVSP
jgi:hypothetical protein